MLGLVEVCNAGWPAAVGAFYTTRAGGSSQGVYGSFNLGTHVGDAARDVLSNRQMLSDSLREPAAATLDFAWLNQVHGTALVGAEHALRESLDADASWTRRMGLACVVMTADCAPVLITDRCGSFVAACHAGWRGLADGVIENTIARLPSDDDVLAWIGPTISQAAFEVGSEVLHQLVALDSENASFFLPVERRSTHFKADLSGMVKHALLRAGVAEVSVQADCTFADAERFYSYRRDGVTGRQASLIFIKGAS